MSALYTYRGIEIPLDRPSAVNYDKTVRAIAHRGYSTVAPENTLPAFRLAAAQGFSYVETDVSFTSDGVPVCLHDATVDRTSNGSGSIGSLTLAQVKELDFGSWKDELYAGTTIPTFGEFLGLCRALGLHPYIELKSNGAYTESQIRTLVDLVEDHGLKGKVTWISFSSTFLTYIKNYDPSARLGYISGDVVSTTIETAGTLKTVANEVFVNTMKTTSDVVALCRNAHLPMEVWTINSKTAIRELDPYISGVTSDLLVAGKVLHDGAIEGTG